MKIVVLEGSPNKNGSSNLLASEFIRGAQEAGHSCTVIDAAHANLHPCTGCVRCGYEGPCVQKDDMERFRCEILDADMMVFVTPLYYYGMSAQLKTLIDRFCAFNSSIQHKYMQAAPAVPEPHRPGPGAGLRLRHAGHDPAVAIPAKSLRTGAQPVSPHTITPRTTNERTM